MRKDVYLKTVPWWEARALFLETALGPGRHARTEAEVIPTAEAVSRVTAAPAFAVMSWPHYHAAAMDGVAVCSRDTAGASESNPGWLSREQYDPVDTGDPLPPGRDAVIMSEELHPLPDGRLEVIAAVPPWDNVRAVGEDVVAGEMVVPAGHRLGPADVGALLAAGVVRIAVRGRPRVGIIPTGDELVPVGKAVAPGQIPEFNSAILAGMLGEWGAVPVVYPPVPDDPGAVRDAMVRAAAECDLVLTIGGSSAGSGDYTARAMAECGEVLVHGVNTRPGKPVVLGLVRTGAAGGDPAVAAHGSVADEVRGARGPRPAVGIPGYPVSAVLAMELFVRPLVVTLQGLPPPTAEVLRGRLTRRLASAAGVEEFVRVRVGRVGDEWVVAPLSRGAGLTTSLVRADGWLVVPAGVEGFAEGQEVEVQLLRGRDEIEGCLLVTGSHDPALDVLGSLLGERHPGLGLSSGNVGSLAGLVALGRGECHAAGCHLLDPETGEYNAPYVRRLLPGRRVLLFPLHFRQQGIMVAPGDPKGIRGIEDLARADVSFVNRQRGSGTRVLLDWLLGQKGISPHRVNGYGREMFTHAQVAVAVESGTADAGLGVLSAAKALGLDFVAVAEEQYDLAFLPRTTEDGRVRALMEVARSEAFSRALEVMGGYRPATGDAREVGP
ncbi:MAG: molybdopterin biosynthesis protein [Bacillota bacterium]